MDPEAISARFKGFDNWSDLEILDALWQGQSGAVAAVRAALPALARAASDMAERLSAGGRLMFVGAGTSGQLAALEAVEVPATFGWPADRTPYRVAGYKAPPGMIAEDSPDYAVALMEELDPSRADCMVAVAASGMTPYTVAAAAHAFARGTLVVAIFNREKCALRQHAHHPVYLASGVEVPAGSTRMNAGTSQKAALNLLSTLVMTRLGRVHDGLMVNLRPDRAKFRERAIRTVAAIVPCSLEEAARCIDRADGSIKIAVLLARGAGREEAANLLAACGDSLRSAMQRLG